MRRIPCLLFFFCLSLTLPTTMPASGQNIRIDVQLQQITATVTDSDGRTVTGLRPEDFVVQWNGTAQQIAHFSIGSDTPVTLGLVIDISSSMWYSLGHATYAAATFVRAMRPRDEAFLMAFAGGSAVLQDFTREPSRIIRALDAIDSVGGSTDILPAVMKAAAKARKGIYQKRAIILISDGRGGTDSPKVRKQVREAETLIYPIQVQALDHYFSGPAPLRGATTRSQREAAVRNAEKDTMSSRNSKNPVAAAKLAAFVAEVNSRAGATMEALASESGGRRFVLDAEASNDDVENNLSAMLREISAELRGQYTLGFYPPAQADARTIRVRMNDPSYRVRISTSARLH